MTLWLVSTYDYCAPRWAAGLDCSGPPWHWWTWLWASTLAVAVFALFLKLLHYGVTGTLQLLFARPHRHSLAYLRQFAAMRKLALERDEYRCVVCGAKEHLEVHHRLARAQGGTNTLDNLVTLCRFHHGQVHGRKW